MKLDLYTNITSRFILPIGFIVIIAIMVFTHVFAISGMRKNSELMNTSIQTSHINNKIMRNMLDAAYDRSNSLLGMLNTKDFKKIEALNKNYEQADIDFHFNRYELEKQNTSEKLRTLLEKQDGLTEKIRPLEREIKKHILLGITYNNLEYLTKHGEYNTIDLFEKTLIPAQKQLFDNINQIIQYQFTSSEKIYTHLQSRNDNTLKTLIIIDLISILFSTFLTTYIVKSEKHKKHKLTQQANTDILTELPNRGSFISSLDHRIKSDSYTPFTVVFFDIDHFKSINDNFGHEIGDEVIKQFAMTIKTTMESDDILCRLGGDEFVLLIENARSKQLSLKYVENLSKTLDTSFKINDKEVFISASIGASLYKQHGESARTVLKNADIAMYSAKQAGRNGFQFFSNRTKLLIEKEHALSQALNTVIKNKNKDGQLHLKYQPLMTVGSNKFTECEALIRWTNRQGDNIPTDEFIAIAEKTNLIDKINSYVITQACSQQKQWQDMGITNIRININLSGNKLSFHNMLLLFNNTIDELSLEPQMFGIELTERTILDVSEETINSLEECRKSGMKISIDDFGTGFSSLSYLKKLPITTIKIDKSFISGLPEDKDDHELVKTIITLGHSLNLEVVAEGIETKEQLQFLQQHDCDIAQGYYFHIPLNEVDLIQSKLVA